MVEENPSEKSLREETEDDEDKHPAEQEIGEREGPTKDAKDDRIAEVAKREIESTSIGDLSRRFRVSKERVRLALRERNIVLRSQSESLEKEGPEEAKDKDQRIVERVTDAQATSLVRDWTEQTTKGLLEDISNVGTVIVNQLRPKASSMGVSVMDLITRAFESEKTLEDLTNMYRQQSSNFGHTDVLEYLNLTVRFHGENYSLPLEMEEIKGLIKEFVAEREFDERVSHLTRLLLSNKREDRNQFIFETMGGSL